jgi:hypothetical protein
MASETMNLEEAETVLERFYNQPTRLTDGELLGGLDLIVEAALVKAGAPPEKVKELVEDIRALE